MGLTKEQTDKLEAPLEHVSLATLRERIDAVMGKEWGFQFEGPEIIAVPHLSPAPTTKAPNRMLSQDRPFYRCSCSIMLFVTEGQPVIREYTIQLPVADGAFETAREMSFIYAAHHGWGVGKKTADVFADETEIELQVGPPIDELIAAKKVLASAKAKLGIKKNTELDRYVEEWSAGEMTSHMLVTKKDLPSFAQFLNMKVPENVRQSDQAR